MKKGSSLSGDGFVFATFSRPPPAPPVPALLQEEGRAEIGTPAGDVRDR